MTDQAAHEARLRDSVVRGEDIDLSHEELLALLDDLAASRALVEQLAGLLDIAVNGGPMEQDALDAYYVEARAAVRAAAVPDRNEDA